MKFWLYSLKPKEVGYFFLRDKQASQVPRPTLDIHGSRGTWLQTSRLDKFNIKNDKLINHHFYLYSLKQQRSGIILLEIKQADFETKLGRCTHFVLSNSEIFFCPALHWNVKYLALKYEICSSQRFRCSNINSLPQPYSWIPCLHKSENLWWNVCFAF